MSTGLQIMLLAGTLLGLGVVLTGAWLAPARPDAADVVARLSGAPSRRRLAPAPTSSGSTEDELQEKLGLAAMRLLPEVVWAKTPTKDLVLLRKTLAGFYGEKVTFALIPLIGVPVLSAIVSIVFPLPLPIPVLGTVLLAAGAWFLPNFFVADDAKIARKDFERELAAYVDLVAMERANGSGARQSMELAARMGDTWVFQRIGEELARSRWSGEAPWDALRVMSEDLDLPKLDEVANTMRLAGDSDVQVYDSLRKLSAALRDNLLKAELAEANAANERMSMPASLLGIIFLAILVGPALMRLL